MATVTVALTSRFQYMLARLWWILHDSDPDFLELFSGALGFLWGLWLLIPTWDTFNTTPSFAAMAALAPEWLWGSVIMGGGLLQVAMTIWGSLRLRSWATLGALLTWGFIATMLAISNFRATGGVVYFSICFSQVWAYLRIGIERDRKQ